MDTNKKLTTKNTKKSNTKHTKTLVNFVQTFVPFVV